MQKISFILEIKIQNTYYYNNILNRQGYDKKRDTWTLDS